MISIAAARDGLAQIIRDHAPLIRVVYPRAIDDGVIPTPAVVMAATVSGTFDTPGAACAGIRNDSIDLPLAVFVTRDGTAEEATQTELETAWLQVLDVLRTHLDDPPLRDVGYSRRVTSVEPGDYVIGGTDYPAQILHIEFKG